MRQRKETFVTEPFDAARALRWLRQLKKHNDRVWFAEHRSVYDEHVRPEWEDMVTALLITAVTYDERFAYVDPKRCLFRLARDIRFSNDKTPFKTGVSAWLSPLGKSGANAGYYVRVAPGETIFSAGIYTPEKPVLFALRKKLTTDYRAFDRILNAKKLKPYLPLTTDGLVRMPAGFPKEHPRGELIRARNYLVRRHYPDAEVARIGAFTAFKAALRDCSDYVRYIDDVAASALRQAQDRPSSAAMREPIDGWEENSTSDHFGPSSSARF